MASLMALSILLSTIVGTVVSVRVLRIARRTHMFPEWAVGLALFSYAALAQTSLFVTRALGDHLDLLPRVGLSAFRVAAYSATLVGLAAFTWRVFGKGSRWRMALFGLIALTGPVMAAIMVRALWMHESAGIELPVWHRLGTTLQYPVAFGWMAAESIRYHGRMRRRAALGLTDPLVANRFLVWGTGAACSSAIVFGLFVRTLVTGQLAIGDTWAAVFVTAAGLVNTVVWWLTFMPPQAYRRWVRARVPDPSRPR